MKYYKDNKNFVILIKNLFDTIELNILLNPPFFFQCSNPRERKEEIRTISGFVTHENVDLSVQQGGQAVRARHERGGRS